MSSLVILDAEAVAALGTTRHPKAGRVLAHLGVVAGRRRRGADVRAVVATTVRVEAGWDRTVGSWALANSLRIEDLPLDAGRANAAASIRAARGVSPAGAHIGAIVASSDEPMIVLTSDRGDIAAVAGTRRIQIVEL